MFKTEKMKVLMVTNNLYPNMNANSEIVYRLAADLLKNHQCDVTVLGYDDSISDTRENEPHGIKSINVLEENNRLLMENPAKLDRMFSCVCHPRWLRFRFRCLLKDKLRDMKEIRTEINQLCRNEQYDCIIAFSDPIITQVASIPICEKKPVIFYSLDPNSSAKYRFSKKEIADLEQEINKYAASIIVTNLLNNAYKNDPICAEKTTVLEFPNIIKPSKTIKKNFDKEHIHCTFAGKLYQNIRNPWYTINLLGALKDSGIVFHIIGRECGCLEGKELPENVIYHGNFTSDDASDFMQASDVLINIGNTVTDMMPSKILTYISTGKPILNIIKTPECPTLPYMERYPLALNILETETVEPETIEKVRDFCLSNRGKQIPFEEIEKEYYTCTPEYVGQQLYDIICKVVEERKKKND